jgi:hypothetical protein
VRRDSQAGEASLLFHFLSNRPTFHNKYHNQGVTMLTTQQAVALKAQAQAKRQEEYRLALITAVVEDVVTMKSAFQQFTITQYNQSK